MSAQILLSMIAPGVPPAPQGPTGGTIGEFEALLAGLTAGAMRSGEADAAAPASPIEGSTAAETTGPALPVPSPLAPAAPVTLPAAVGEAPDIVAPADAEGDTATAPAEKAGPAAGVELVDGTDDTPADEAAADTAAPSPAAPDAPPPSPAPATDASVASTVPAPSDRSASSPPASPQPLPAPVAAPAAAATPPQGEPAAQPDAAPAAATAAAPVVPSTPTPPATPVAVAVAGPPAASPSPPPPLRAPEGNAAASRDKRGSDTSTARQDSDLAQRPTGDAALTTAKPTLEAGPAPAHRPERSGEVSPRLQPEAAMSNEVGSTGPTDAGPTPQDGAPSVIREASTPAHLVSRTAVEATAQIAAQIFRKLDGRSTRFEMALLPEELGRVDVKLDIDSEGRVAARLAFDNPAAAADLRGRADELRRQLEQAGLQLADDAFEFAERDSGSSAFDRGDDPRHGSGRAFTAAARLHAEADAVPAARWTSLSLTPAGVDLKV